MPSPFSQPVVVAGLSATSATARSARSRSTAWRMRWIATRRSVPH